MNRTLALRRKCGRVRGQIHSPKSCQLQHPPVFLHGTLYGSRNRITARFPGTVDVRTRGYRYTLYFKFLYLFIRFVSGEYDHVAGDHWRIMTVAALYRLNDSAEAGLPSQLSGSNVNLKRVLDAAFPGSTRAAETSSFSVTTNSCSGLRSSDELVQDLFFKIQFFVCSRLELTIAPETNDSYRTYALGLDRISDGVRVTILEVAEEDNERATPWVSSLDDQYHCFYYFNTYFFE